MARPHLAGVKQRKRTCSRRRLGRVACALARKYPAPPRVGLAVGVPGDAPLLDRENRPAPPPSPPRSVLQRLPRRSARPTAPSAPPATPCATRSPPICWRTGRHPHRAGAARPPRRQHHDDLHPRPQPRPGRRPQPPRPPRPLSHSPPCPAVSAALHWSAYPRPPHPQSPANYAPSRLSLKIRRPPQRCYTALPRSVPHATQTKIIPLSPHGRGATYAG